MQDRCNRTEFDHWSGWDDVELRGAEECVDRCLLGSDSSARGVKREVHTRELSAPLRDARCERSVVALRVEAVGDQ